MSAEEDAHICECIELVCPAAGEFFCFASTEEGGNEMRDSKIDQKQPVVKEIAALLDGASSAVVVDYRGLTVEQDTQLRKQLREAGVVYKVYKNTMVRIAAKGTEFEKFDAYLEGPTALAVSKDDATAPARLLAKFAKTAPKLEIKGGIVEGAAYDRSGSVERGAARQTLRQHAEPDHELCTRHQADCREGRGTGGRVSRSFKRYYQILIPRYRRIQRWQS